MHQWRVESSFIKGHPLTTTMRALAGLLLLFFKLTAAARHDNSLILNIDESVSDAANRAVTVSAPKLRLFVSSELLPARIPPSLITAHPCSVVFNFSEGRQFRSRSQVLRSAIATLHTFKNHDKVCDVKRFGPDDAERSVLEFPGVHDFPEFTLLFKLEVFTLLGFIEGIQQ